MNARLDWILSVWFASQREASSISSEFHDAYAAQFPKYQRKAKLWGAQPVGQAMRDLSSLWKQGKLRRVKISLGGVWQPGFPKWVWSYTTLEA